MNDRDTASLIIDALGGSKNIIGAQISGNHIIISVSDTRPCNVSEFEDTYPIENVDTEGSDIYVTVNRASINGLSEKMAEILNTESMPDELEEEEEDYDDEPFPSFNSESFQSSNNASNPYPTINKDFDLNNDSSKSSSFDALNNNPNISAGFGGINSGTSYQTLNDTNNPSSFSSRTSHMPSMNPTKNFEEELDVEEEPAEEKVDKKALRESAKRARAEELAQKQAEKEQAKAEEIAKKEAAKQAKIDEANKKKADALQAKADEIAKKQAEKQAKIDEKARKKAEKKSKKTSYDSDINTLDNTGLGMYNDTLQGESDENILQAIANIFSPIIPAFIACGLMTTIYKIILIFYPSIANTNLGRISSVIAYSAFTILPIIVGYNASREFCGSPIIGAVLALVLTSPSINGIKLAGVTLTASSGGIFSILLIAFLAARLEIVLRNHIARAYDKFLNPIITIVIMSFLGLLAVQPLGALMAKYIAEFMRYIVYTHPKVSGIASLLYLPVVMLGLQDGLYAVNMSVIQSIGFTYLLPIICMSGAGQVGASLYVLLKTQNPRIRTLCFTSLPLGILGIGEPLMWGITVPLGRPFIASCLGAAFGGTFIAFMKVSTDYLELSGLPLAFFTNKPLYYILGLLISYITGFLCCMILKFKDPK